MVGGKGGGGGGEEGGGVMRARFACVDVKDDAGAGVDGCCSKVLLVVCIDVLVMKERRNLVSFCSTSLLLSSGTQSKHGLCVSCVPVG